jgi:pyruvate,water dikinase
VTNINVLAKGIGLVNRVETGDLIVWKDSFLNKPHLLTNKIIYNEGDAPLYRMAFLIENKVKAVLLEQGGRNYHPLILLSDALVPAIAGVGKLNLSVRHITIDCGKGIVYSGYKYIKPKLQSQTSDIDRSNCVKTKVYVNVGYPTALEEASKSGADGIGLLRTEFTAARTLSKILNNNISNNRTIKKEIELSNEADVIYKIARNNILKKWLKNDLKETISNAIYYFKDKEIIIRTFDIARDENDPMGNRGIRRCMSEGGYTLKILSNAIKEAIDENKAVKCNIGILLPLVSHYSQINGSLNIILSSGLSLRINNEFRKNSIGFGWEIEQPAATLNNEFWIEAFRKEYNTEPHFIGIGTNDLTQFTIALERDAYSNETNKNIKNYIKNLYDESDYSVISQIYEVSKQCKRFGIKLFLLGEAAARIKYTELISHFGIIPSVAYHSVRRVRKLIFDIKKNKRESQVIENYIDDICNQYPQKARIQIKLKLLQMIK